MKTRGDTKHPRFEDTKRTMSPEKFRDFRETGSRKRIVENHADVSNCHKVSLSFIFNFSVTITGLRLDRRDELSL